MEVELLNIGHGLFATVDAGTLEETGVVNFRDGRQWIGRIGSVEWRALKIGDETYVGKYMFVGGKDSVLLIHRAITSAPGNSLVDHRDGIPLNNTRINLRTCEHWQNMANRKKQHNSTGFKGVTRNSAGNYQAYISSGGKTVPLGTFDDVQDAARAYDAAAIRIHGEFARLNSQLQTA